MLRLVLAHVRAQPLRFGLTAGSVALALFLYCSLQTVLTSLDTLVTGTSGNRLITSSAVSLFQSLPVSGVERVRTARVPGVRSVGHWTWFDGVFRDPKEFFARFAVDVPTFRAQYGDEAPGGQDYLLTSEEWDRFELERAGCIVGRGLAERYGFEVGDPLVLEGTIYPGTWRFTVVAIYGSDNPTYDEETMFFHWPYLNEGTGRADVCGTFTIDLDPKADAAAASEAIDSLFRNSSNRTLTQLEAAFSAQFLQMWGNIGLLFGFIGYAVVFATFVISLNTMLLSVRERVREVGVLKTLGFRSGTVRGLFLLEALVVCGGGALAGAGLARVLWHGQPLRLATVIFPEFLVTDETLVEAAVIGALLALVAGLAPAVVASRLTIVRALRSG
ncbi:MAG: FtsX-like permease family protein [Planctomycetota bacterium]|nr:FtsX-like permease family protein [Planctomycetota bacterium]MDA0934487.1 FtsX-like permease family protein [Planctomycetota bacterium]MDA1222980.1 FtsX-like permease family protein [Planctomycetota bacterium]